MKTSREAYVRKVTWIGLLINIALACIKFAAGYFGRSQAMIADAIHSLTDTTTDVAVIAGSHFWSRPPDESHPYGHRRLETLVTVFIGLMLAAAGIGIGWDAVSALRDKESTPPGWIALVAAAVSILTKEILYRWTAVVGKKIKSPALAANAWHHRTDAISSIPVLIAVGGALIFPSWSFLDLVGAVVVSIFVMHAAMKIIWPGISELIDAGAPKDIQKKITDIACNISGVQEVHKVRTRYISTSILVDMHIVVDGSISVRDGHAIADEVENQIINSISNVLGVVIHVDPSDVEQL
ncbi:Cobalt-zinc-cadmium resistance protein [Olavius sp. associated proteobacterium Delta 1]|nr:Cobalt-zinc-cadmium resistance protein [Olavius sp. associated proteobacterium Delta 1]